MKPYYDLIYLSPHLDDAVLSCAGQIYQFVEAGRSVLIVTIMAGDPSTADLSPFAQNLHERWEVASDAVAVRREEDKAASELLGVDFWHLDVLDCIYRRHPESGEALYASEEALFGDIHPAEMALAQSLAHKLDQMPRPDQALAPLTAGHHVDHQLTRLAAELWLGQDRLRYYEEFPYVLADGAMPADLTKARGWLPQVIGLSDQALKMRIEATACYRSQLSTFFRDKNDMAKSVKNHVHGTGGERIWSRHIVL
jgi:LmbE family N-acetylglucosaminyl deacetylase